MGFFSEGFLGRFLSFIGLMNKDLYEQDKRISLIVEAAEIPSPAARMSLNEQFLNEIDKVVEKHYPGALMVSVTDTNSMDPLVDIGHKVVLIPMAEAAKEAIQEGDVVWFHRISDGSPNVMHRVIQKRPEWIVTRGDNTVKMDGPTINRNIKGYCGMIIY